MDALHQNVGYRGRVLSQVLDPTIMADLMAMLGSRRIYKSTSALDAAYIRLLFPSTGSYVSARCALAPQEDASASNSTRRR